MPIPFHDSRIARVRDAMARHRSDWLLVPASADFTWLTGARARTTERLVALALPAAGEPFVLVPRLESDALRHECPWLALEIWEEHEDPFERLFRRMGLRRGPAVLVGNGLRTALALRLAARARCLPAAAVLGPLRAVKDAGELRLLERAAAHADEVIEDAADFARPGMTEREVARFVFERFETLGDHDPWAIVASGKHAALPHHMTSGRVLEADDVLLLDVGAFTDGYGSDVTRTFWLGDPAAEAGRLYQIVNDARAAAIEAARAGVACHAVDRAAREVITRGGYGAQFLHRTGHGVGLEVHELPYLVAGNAAPLEAGMVHSVEPGVYLSGRLGVRLEDLVVVESGGARLLNRAPLDPRPRRMRP